MMTAATLGAGVGALWWGWDRSRTDTSLDVSPEQDLYYMESAFAQIGAGGGRVGLPIGAVVVWHGRIVGVGHNRNRVQGSPIQHAELQAIDDAIAHFVSLGPKRLIRQRLKESIVYTTLEPCPMCAGTMLMAHLKAVVYCMQDRRWGAAGTAGVLSGFPSRLETRRSDAPVCRELSGLRFQDKATQRRLRELGRLYQTKLSEGQANGMPRIQPAGR